MFKPQPQSQSQSQSRLQPQFRPLLAASLTDFNQPCYPAYLSPKLDGIRCLWRHETGRVVARSLRPIANQHIVATLRSLLSQYASTTSLDGELIVGSTVSPDSRRITQSAVNSREGQPVFSFHVFDSLSYDNSPFTVRLKRAQGAVYSADNESLTLIPQHLVTSADEAQSLYLHYIRLGYEGVVLRNPLADYKFGRSTIAGGEMSRMKALETAFGTITAVSPLLTNMNHLQRDRLGYAKRTSHKAGKQAREVLGSFTILPDQTESEPAHLTRAFQIGTGFSAEQRFLFWHIRHSLIGRSIEYQYRPAGSYERPNHPVFVRLIKAG